MIYAQYLLVPGGGFFHPNRTWMCLLDLENLTISIPIFLPNFPPISIPFSKEKHPILIKLGAFYNNLPKIHPIYVIWAPFVSDENPPIAIPNFAKKCPKRQAHIRISCQCENPPGIGLAMSSKILGSTASRPIFLQLIARPINLGWIYSILYQTWIIIIGIMYRRLVQCAWL